MPRRTSLNINQNSSLMMLTNRSSNRSNFCDSDSNLPLSITLNPSRFRNKEPLSGTVDIINEENKNEPSI